MAEREGTPNSSTTAGSSPSAVVPYQLTSQLESKLFDGAVITVAFFKNEGVCYSHVEQKVKDVFVNFLHFILKL